MTSLPFSFLGSIYYSGGLLVRLVVKPALVAQLFFKSVSFLVEIRFDGRLKLCLSPAKLEKLKATAYMQANELCRNRAVLKI